MRNISIDFVCKVYVYMCSCVYVDVYVWLCVFVDICLYMCVCACLLINIVHVLLCDDGNFLLSLNILRHHVTLNSIAANKTPWLDNIYHRKPLIKTNAMHPHGNISLWCFAPNIVHLVMKCAFGIIEKSYFLNRYQYGNSKTFALEFLQNLRHVSSILHSHWFI